MPSVPTSPRPFTYAAVVLAGGYSRRMGTDKAHLPHPRSGQPLLVQQLALLAELQPAPQERWVSARCGQNLPPLPPGVGRIDDDGCAGPLGGIVAAFAATTAPALLVLAVDLPDLDPIFLHALLAHAAGPPDRGAAPHHPLGWEPLIAVYPRSIEPLLRSALAAGNHRLQRLLDGSAGLPLLSPFPVSSTAPALRNWNLPEPG